MKGKVNKKKNGFTLVELLIVLALLVIFSVATIPFGLNMYRSRILQEETETNRLGVAAICTEIEEELIKAGYWNE